MKVSLTRGLVHFAKLRTRLLNESLSRLQTTADGGFVLHVHRSRLIMQMGVSIRVSKCDKSIKSDLYVYIFIFLKD